MTETKEVIPGLASPRAEVLASESSVNSALGRRIWITRYLMVIGIVLLHVPPYQSLAELGNSPLDLIKSFFSHGLFRATVPVLTAISGYLIFRSELWRQPRRLLQKKVSTLLVPMIVWNLPFALAVFMLQKNHLVDHAFAASLYPFDAGNWLNAVIGMTGNPVNYPLNFLRDLFVIALLSPFFGWMLNRSPMLGLAVVGLVYWSNIDGQLVLRQSMLISFYIGGLAAAKNWDLTALDRFAVPALAIMVLYCLGISLFDIENRELYRLVSPFLVWPAISIIVNRGIGDWLYRNSAASFFTFLSHGPILLVLWWIFNKLPSGIPYFYFWVVGPVIAISLGAWLAPVFKRELPRIASMTLGGR
jgi:succinoglycan biosynthesis protein ExoH